MDRTLVSKEADRESPHEEMKAWQRQTSREGLDQEMDEGGVGGVGAERHQVCASGI